MNHEVQHQCQVCFAFWWMFKANPTPSPRSRGFVALWRALPRVLTDFWIRAAKFVWQTFRASVDTNSQHRFDQPYRLYQPYNYLLNCITYSIRIAKTLRYDFHLFFTLLILVTYFYETTSGKYMEKWKLLSLQVPKIPQKSLRNELPGKKRKVPFFWSNCGLVLGVKLVEINSNLFSESRLGL